LTKRNKRKRNEKGNEGRKELAMQNKGAQFHMTTVWETFGC
jgi:hypothetical protein